MDEQQAFNAMIEIYEKYRNNELSEELLATVNEQIGDDWIAHAENELIQMGLEFHKILQEQEQ